MFYKIRYYFQRDVIKFSLQSHQRFRDVKSVHFYNRARYRANDRFNYSYFLSSAVSSVFSSFTKSDFHRFSNDEYSSTNLFFFFFIKCMQSTDYDTNKHIRLDSINYSLWVNYLRNSIFLVSSTAVFLL